MRAQPYHSARHRTPFAVLGICTRADKLIGVEYLKPEVEPFAPRDELAAEVCRQVDAYLEDPGYRFDLPLELEGTEFQVRLWRALTRIPVGCTRTYGDMARLLRTAPRPIGGACGSNPIPLIVPCHRVVASGGLGGFMHAANGRPLNIKRWLLRHEGVL